MHSKYCRIDGEECCFGFALNRTTGECEKCSIGYYGTDCATKCIYPTYGEDCQSRCQCSNETCHFSRGCLPNDGTVVEYQELGSTKKYLENIGISSPPVKNGLSTSTHKSSESTREILPQNNDLLKNNIVISLLGIFVLFFSVFVISYIYLKCFRKKAIASVINASELQAQYKSLNISLIEPENTVQPAHPGRTEMDSAYLLPVFSRNEVNEFEIKLESDKPILDTNVHSYEITNRHELDSMTDNVQDHVYIEITKDNTGISNTVVKN